MTTTETFTRNGEPYIDFIERVEGGLLFQTTAYLAGPRAGTTDLSVRLVDPSGDVEILIAAHREMATRPGFRDSGRGGEEGRRRFIAQTNGWGVLHANNRSDGRMAAGEANPYRVEA